jgi:hypothetical protein
MTAKPRQQTERPTQPAPIRPRPFTGSAGI